MTAERVDAVVVGAGVVGLAVARALGRAGHEVLVLEREATVPAGRVLPEAYGAFADFAHAVDEAFDRDVVITLP